MLPNITNLLKQSSEINSLVSDRIFRRGEAPEGVSGDYITWEMSGLDPENFLGDRTDVDKISIDVKCWSKIDKQSEKIADAARAALESHCHLVNVFDDKRDEKTRLYLFSLEFDYFLER